MPIRITGLQGTLRAVGKAKEKTSKTIAEGLRTAAETLLKESQKLVPVDTGALKASGRVEVSGTAMGARAQVVYGGGVVIDISQEPDPAGTTFRTVDYAYVVHERLDVYHRPPTQARFLADAVPKVRGTITAAMKRQVEVALGGFS